MAADQTPPGRLTTDADEHDPAASQPRLMRALVDRVPAMLGYWDAQSLCRFANRAYMDWFGLAPEKLLGHHIAELLGPLYLLNLPFIEGALRGEEQRFEREIPDPAGGPARPSHVHYRPDIGDGVVRGFVVLVTDVSYRKRAEAAEQRFAQQAAGRLAALTTLASGLAHEINNPLGATLANLDLLAAEVEQGPVSPDVLRGALTEARAGARRVAAIIQGMKLLGRGRGVEHDPHDVTDIDDTIRSSLAVTANTYRFCARLEANLDSHAAVVGDAAQLTQVFVHLLMNAVQALPARPADENLIRVTSRRVDGWVVITVEDNGRGIPPANRERVFEPFFTARGHGPGGTGVGLGLPISLAIIEAFGGQLTFESEENRSTVFQVRLPLADVQRVQLPASSPPVGESVPQTQKAPERPRVLVVDDERTITMVLQRALRADYWAASTPCTHRRQLHRPIRVYDCRFGLVGVVVVVVASLLACSALAASSARTLSPLSSSTVL